MKKKVLLMMVTISMLCLFGCGNKAAQGGQEAEQQPAEESVKVDVKDAAELLANVWNTYEEAEMFPIGGGDSENIVMDTPGKYDVSKAEEMDSVLGLPQDKAVLIDDAASMMHMMNANTFTCGAFHLKDAADQQAFADALKENIMNRQWMCGFPDTLLIVAVGEDYVISAFGNAEIMETFKTKVVSQYDVAEVMYEESLTE